MSILFLACILAICLPILSVQLPRFLPHLRTSNITKAHHKSKSEQEHPLNPTPENRSPLHKRPPPVRRRIRPRRPATTDGADSGVVWTGDESGEGTGSEEIHRQPPYTTSTTGLLNVEGVNIGKTDGTDKGKGRADGRKPWDPPFGRSRERLRKRETREDGLSISLPSPPKKTGRDMEATGIARRLFPPDSEGGSAYDCEPHNGLLESDHEDTPRSASTPTPASGTKDLTSTDGAKPASAKKKSKSRPGVTSAIWICVGIFAVFISILTFAILIAHCLAWFLVYKTEARLGEVRRGIMQGGEMRLCLCAT